ncbi:MAG: transcription antitermination factor NusB [Propionibacteriales bacterium]|nr:transcription antitermination factor NusB [Propionibacteriales bacterium]
MAARTKARRRAVEVLFESELRGLPAGRTLEVRRDDPQRPMNAYAVSLVEGVVAHQARIDELISTYAVGWSLDRMPAVDRNLLRIGVFELLWVDDVPDGVVLSEAVGLARELSTDESPGFVNGLLARLAEEKPHLVVDPPSREAR